MLSCESSSVSGAAYAQGGLLVSGRVVHVIQCSRKCSCAPNIAKSGRWHLVLEKEGRLLYSYDTWASKEVAMTIAIIRGLRVAPEIDLHTSEHSHAEEKAVA